MWCGTGITVWWCDTMNNATNTDTRLIEEIDITSDSSGCTDDIAIIWSADSAMMDYPLGLPFCGSNPGYQITSVMQACCWNPAYIIPGEKSLLPCVTVNYEGYCVYTCHVCKDPSSGLLETSNCSTTSIGFPPSCALPPPGNNFSLNQCYVVGCNPND